MYWPPGQSVDLDPVYMHVHVPRKMCGCVGSGLGDVSNGPGTGSVNGLLVQVQVLQGGRRGGGAQWGARLQGDGGR